MQNNNNSKSIYNYVMNIHRRMSNVISSRNRLEYEINDLTGFQFADVLGKCELPELRLLHYKLNQARKLQAEASNLLLKLV